MAKLKFGKNSTLMNRMGTSSIQPLGPLLLNIDVSDSLSWSGSGTTWSDLSGRGNHATLHNGAFWDGTGISVGNDTSSKYISIPKQVLDGRTEWSVVIWVQMDSYNSQRSTMIHGGIMGNSAENLSFSFDHTNTDVSYYNRTFTRYGSSWPSPPLTPLMMTLRADVSGTGYHINQGFVANWAADPLAEVRSDLGLVLGQRILGNTGEAFSAGSKLKGKFLSVKIYDKKLSFTELSAIYQTDRTVWGV